jgi:uncharacterized protein YggU (UPF0235/DUF167 family)
VQPGSRRPGLGGLSPDGGALRVAVGEAPENGRANRAACAAVAAARLRTLRVAGDPARLAGHLRELLA